MADTFEYTDATEATESTDHAYLMYWVDTIDAWAHMETVPTFSVTIDIVDRGLSLRLDNESYDDETGAMVTDWTLWDLSGDTIYAIHLDALRDLVGDRTTNVHALVQAVRAEDNVRMCILKNGTDGMHGTEFEGPFESCMEHVCGMAVVHA